MSLHVRDDMSATTTAAVSPPWEVSTGVTFTPARLPFTPSPAAVETGSGHGDPRLVHAI